MFIVRWLLSHPIIFVWVLAAVALLMGYNMDKDHASAGSETAVATEQVSDTENVGTAEQSAGAEQTTASEEPAVSEVVPATSEKNAVPAESVAAVEPATAATPEETTYKNAAEKRVAEASTEEILSTGFFEKSKADKVEANATTENSNIAKTTVETASEDAAGATTENTVEAKVVTTEATAQNKVTPAKSNIELLRSAREAYWAADYDASIKLYQQLIVEQPNVIDHKGELANVYWKQGNPTKAAELYADIAMPLLDLGKVQQVQTMNNFIGQFLPERAKEIAAKLHP